MWAFKPHDSALKFCAEIWEPGPYAPLVLTGKSIPDALTVSIRSFRLHKITIAHKFWPSPIWYRLSLYQSSCRIPLVFFWLCALKKGFGEAVVNEIDLRTGSVVGSRLGF